MRGEDAESTVPQRLRRRDDVRAALRLGRRHEGVAVDIRARLRGDRGPGRATVVAGRRVGTAVRRNRAKRRLRAAIRECGAPAGVDVVLVARQGADRMPYATLRDEVGRVRDVACARGARASEAAS